MKILIFCDSMGIGGAETHVVGLAKDLSNSGHRVTVVAKYGDLVARLISEDVEFIELYSSGRDINNLVKYIFSVKKLIENKKPSVVHAHSRLSAFAVEMVRRSCTCPHFKFVTTAHAKYKTNLALKLLSAWGDHCIAVSDDIKEHLTKNYLIKSEDITVIPNGINTLEFRPRICVSEHRILFVSRLDEDSSLGAICLCKIADRLVEEYPGVKIVIAGGGNDFARVDQLARGKSNVILLGKSQNLCEEMASADVIIGVSRVALEGMSCQKNVILFGNEGALGLLNEKTLPIAEITNFTCRGCGIKGEEFLFEQIKRFFSTDERILITRAKKNREYVLNNHSQDLVTEQTLRVYRKKTKVAICGYYGFGNIGDEALLRALLTAFQKYIPECEMFVFNRNRDKRGDIPRYSFFEVLCKLRRADWLVMGGGSLLQNETSMRSLFYYCSIISMAKLLGCRCMLAANGIGPINKKTAQRMAAATLSKADYISVRDKTSARAIDILTDGRIRAHYTADLCFALNLEPKETDRVRRIKKLGKYAAISLRGSSNGEILSAIFDYCRREGMTPIFVVMDEKYDSKPSYEAARTCGEVIDGLSLEELMSLLVSAQIAIGQRLHFLIFSLLAGTAPVGVGESPKIKAFMRENLNMDPATPESFLDACESLKNVSRDELLEIANKNIRMSKNGIKNLIKNIKQ